MGTKLTRSGSAAASYAGLRVVGTYTCRFSLMPALTNAALGDISPDITLALPTQRSHALCVMIFFNNPGNCVSPPVASHNDSIVDWQSCPNKSGIA